MGIRVEHTVHPLPESYVTEEIVYKYVPSEDDPKVKVRVEETIKHAGGFLVKFMRGHSIRCYDEAHLKRLGFDTAPRLVDEVSGMQCNAQGVPLDIAHLVAPAQEGGDLPELGIENIGDRGSVEAMVEAHAKE